MKKINLLNIVLSLEMGGLENFVVNLVQRLDAGKFNITVCSLKTGGVLQNKLERMGIPVYSMQKKEGIDYSLVFELAKLFRSLKIDLIHTHNPAPWLYGCIAGKIAGINAIVHTEHSHLDISQSRLLKTEWVLSRFTDKIISDAPSVTKFLIEKQGIPSRKIETILNGIDVDRFDTKIDRNEIKNNLGISLDSLVLGCIARLELVKDHATLLEAFSNVADKFPKAVLVLVGDGSQKEKLKEKTKQLGIDGKVLFLGTRTDTETIIQVFDVFLLSSQSEGLSLALLEAMAARKPIVATDVGGNSEIVLDGETGFLVPAMDSHRLSEKIISLISNQNLMSTMGQKGVIRVESKFNIKKMVKDYERVYDECLLR